MSNPAYVYENLVETQLDGSPPGGSASSSTEDATYGLENLYDGIYAKPFRFTSTSGGYIEIDFGSAQSFDTVFIGGHNMLAAGGTVKAGASANPSTTVGTIVHRDQDIWVNTGTQSARYVRVTLTDTNSENVQIGELVIGLRVALPRPPQWGIEPEDIDEGVTLETNGGVLWDYEYFKRYGLDLPFRFPESERAAFRLFNTHVDRVPFVLIPNPATVDAYYGRKLRGIKPRPAGAFRDGSSLALWYDLLIQFRTESLGLVVNL